jgi:ferrous-iron efflux pump FieF
MEAPRPLVDDAPAPAVAKAEVVGEELQPVDEIEARIEADFPGVEVLIHPDPVDLLRDEGDELLPDRTPD